MGEIKVASCTVAELFSERIICSDNTEILGILEVPEYQRPYVWTKKEIKRFMNAVNVAVANISSNPYIGSVSEESHVYRKYLVVEQIYLYYRVTNKNEILLASFWNNYQDPEKLYKFLA